MTLSNIAQISQECVQGINRATQVLLETYRSLFLATFSLSSDKQRRYSPTTQRQVLRSTIWNMRRLLREAMGEDMDKELVAALNSLAQRSDEIQRAVVVWIDLIEVLVQNAEQRSGARPGRGSIKAVEVKEVMRYLLRADRFDIPNVPEFLEPVIIDIVVDWSIDAVVLMTNRYGLWVDTEPPPKKLRTVIVIVWNRVHQFIRLLGLPFAWLGNRLWQVLRPRGSLSPEIQAALEAVEREGLIARDEPLLSGVVDLMAWVGTHRKQLIAAIELVFAAVQEAESYFALSGAEKKSYARDLVFAVLDDLGFVHRAGLLFAIIDSLINGAIEAAVHLFNKRGVFPHRH